MPVEKRGGLGSLWGVHCEDLLSNGGAVGQECEGFLVLLIGGLDIASEMEGPGKVEICLGVLRGFLTAWWKAVAAS